jgi:hypothetical protein
MVSALETIISRTAFKDCIEFQLAALQRGPAVAGLARRAAAKVVAHLMAVRVLLRTDPVVGWAAGAHTRPLSGST